MTNNKKIFLCLFYLNLDYLYKNLKLNFIVMLNLNNNLIGINI